MFYHFLVDLREEALQDKAGRVAVAMRNAGQPGLGAAGRILRQVAAAHYVDVRPL